MAKATHHRSSRADSLQADKAHLNETTDGEYENVDHIARMRELIEQLPDASPSGATTIAQKLTEHLNAHLDPKDYNERQANIRKRHEEDEERRSKRREEVKRPVEEEKAA